MDNYEMQGYANKSIQYLLPLVLSEWIHAGQVELLAQLKISGCFLWDSLCPEHFRVGDPLIFMRHHSDNQCVRRLSGYVCGYTEDSGARVAVVRLLDCYHLAYAEFLLSQYSRMLDAHSVLATYRHELLRHAVVGLRFYPHLIASAVDVMISGEQECCLSRENHNEIYLCSQKHKSCDEEIWLYDKEVLRYPYEMIEGVGLYSRFDFNREAALAWHSCFEEWKSGRT